MEASRTSVPKLSDMVMCGDHSSFTKTELNMKETKRADRERSKDIIPLSYARISPSSSRTERNSRPECMERERARSHQELRPLDKERMMRSLDLTHQPELDVTARRNRALVQAAIGSFRWPPYLVIVWVLVLFLTHLLHCLLNMLERALPTLKNVCEYFRLWTEESWMAEGEGSVHVWPAGLACLTGLLYALYFGLCGVHALASWAVEPLSSDVGGILEERAEPKVTNYEEDINTTTAIAI